MTFGEKFKTRLKEKRLKQVDVARALGVSPQQVNRWISDNVRPENAQTLAKLAAALDLPLDYLANDEITEPSQTLNEKERAVLDYARKIGVDSAIWALDMIETMGWSNAKQRLILVHHQFSDVNDRTEVADDEKPHIGFTPSARNMAWLS